MHCRAALTHLRRLVMQPWRQPQLTSSSEDKDAFGIMVHSGQNNQVSSRIQHQSSGLGNFDVSSSPSLVSPYMASLISCSENMLLQCVGGSHCIDRTFFVNKCFLAMLTFIKVLVLSYKIMMKRSMPFKQAACRELFRSRA